MSGYGYGGYASYSYFGGGGESPGGGGGSNNSGWYSAPGGVTIGGYNLNELQSAEMNMAAASLAASSGYIGDNNDIDTGGSGGNLDISGWLNYIDQMAFNSYVNAEAQQYADLAALSQVIGDTIAQVDQETEQVLGGDIGAESLSSGMAIDAQIYATATAIQALNDSGNQYAYTLDSNGNVVFLTDADGNLIPLDNTSTQQFLEVASNGSLNGMFYNLPMPQATLNHTNDPNAPVEAWGNNTDNTVSYLMPDGTIYTMNSGLDHPDRDNNPMNAGYNQAAIGQDGFFAVFESPEAGFESNMRQFTDDAARQSPTDGTDAVGTIGNAIYNWSPPGANNTEGIIGTMTSLTGLNRNTMWSSLTSEQQVNFLNMYATQIEGWHGGHGQETPYPVGPQPRL